MSERATERDEWTDEELAKTVDRAGDTLSGTSEVKLKLREAARRLRAASTDAPTEEPPYGEGDCTCHTCEVHGPGCRQWEPGCPVHGDLRHQRDHLDRAPTEKRRVLRCANCGEKLDADGCGCSSHVREGYVECQMGRKVVHHPADERCFVCAPTDEAPEGNAEKALEVLYGMAEEFVTSAEGLHVATQARDAVLSRLRRAEQDFQECFAAKQSWKKAHDDLRDELRRLRDRGSDDCARKMFDDHHARAVERAKDAVSGSYQHGYFRGFADGMCETRAIDATHSRRNREASAPRYPWHSTEDDYRGTDNE